MKSSLITKNNSISKNKLNKENSKIHLYPMETPI